MKKIINENHLQPIIEQIPDELKRYNQWVVWKALKVERRNKKVPHNPATGEKGNVITPNTWGDFSSAVNAYEKGGYNGLGFVLTENDPFFGFDLDNCRDPETRKIKIWAKEYINKLNTYTEVSPSGKGVRGFAIGKLPAGGRKRGDIEFYDSGRYLTVTGHHYPGTPCTIIKRQKRVNALHAEIFKECQTHISTEDQALLEKAFESANGTAIKKLYDGGYGNYSSRSEADLALCSHLAFWFKCDPVNIDRVFRTSKLYRGKWDKKNHGGGKTYGEITIQKAIKSTRNTYQDYEDFIDELNKEYALVTLGSKVVVMKEVVDPVFNRPDLIFFSLGDFKNLFLNKKVPNTYGGKSITIAQLWLESSERRTYDRIIFSPGEEIPKCYNLFRGLAITPKKGNWSLFREHIYSVIAGKNEEHLKWVLAWMARLVQEAGGERPGTSIVLRGKEGIGKGKFASTFGKLFGNHFLHLSNQIHLTGHFNNHLKDALYVFCDEGFLAGDRYSIGVLKAMITEDNFLIEPKHKDAYPVKNYINLIIASNKDWIIPTGLAERRFFVLDVSDERKGDYDYFKAIDDQMKNGGLEAMLYDLQDMDITGINLREVPRTMALFDQIVSSMTPIQKFWYERLSEETLINQHPEWRRRVKTEILYKEYVKFARRIDGGKPEINITFSKQLKYLCPEIKRKRARKPDKRNKRPYYYYVPSLDVCRKLFEDSMKITIDWE